MVYHVVPACRPQKNLHAATEAGQVDGGKGIPSVMLGR